jgi:hypothetical protein
MSRQLTAADAKQSLIEHVAARGAEVCLRYGPVLSWDGLARLLEDRRFVRYPCEVVFDASRLMEGEIGHPEPKGELPEQGFTMYVHPAFATNRDEAVAIVLYQLVVVNYGEFAAADEAESFGAAALGIGRDDYYAMLCEVADRVGESPTEVAAEACGGGCCGN